MKTLLAIILIAITANLCAQATNTPIHAPEFRYSPKLLDNYKDYYWEIVKEKFNIKIENGKIKTIEF